MLTLFLSALAITFGVIVGAILGLTVLLTLAWLIIRS